MATNKHDALQPSWSTYTWLADEYQLCHLKMAARPQSHSVMATSHKHHWHAVADTFLDAEESEEEDADRGTYDYKDLAAAFDQGGFDGLSQSDTSDAASMSDGDVGDDDEAAGTGPFKPAAKRMQQKQKGTG